MSPPKLPEFFEAGEKVLFQNSAEAVCYGTIQTWSHISEEKLPEWQKRHPAMTDEDVLYVVASGDRLVPLSRFDILGRVVGFKANPDYEAPRRPTETLQPRRGGLFIS